MEKLPRIGDLTAGDADVMTGEPPVFIRRRTLNREIRDTRRAKTAAEAIAGWGRDLEVAGFTKGQFSLIDLIRAVVDIVGQVDEMLIATWTASHNDVRQAIEFFEAGTIARSRWLVDLTFQRRTPALADYIRRTFGPDAIRVAPNHAKLVALSAPDWRVVVDTSMNLNHNPRFENFAIAHDPARHAFIESLFDEIWTAQPAELALASPGEVARAFRAL